MTRSDEVTSAYHRYARARVTVISGEDLVRPRHHVRERFGRSRVDLVITLQIACSVRFNRDDE